jgi:t-SNARE complex subunit (syntaxin)
MAEAEVDPTSSAYAKAARRSNLFGVVTLVVVFIIIVLMVTKPI